MSVGRLRGCAGGFPPAQVMPHHHDTVPPAPGPRRSGWPGRCRQTPARATASALPTARPASSPTPLSTACRLYPMPCSVLRKTISAPCRQKQNADDAEVLHRVGGRLGFARPQHQRRKRPFAEKTAPPRLPRSRSTGWSARRADPDGCGHSGPRRRSGRHRSPPPCRRFPSAG